MQTATKGMQYTFRPIEQWPREPTPAKKRRRATFRASYSTVIKGLERELQHLGAKIAVIQAAVSEDDIRKDGLIRASVSPKHPGVVVACETKAYGWMQFPCDAFDDWKANLRAIVLTLERLRLIDRDGVTRHGEQYRGWQALPSPATGDHSGPIRDRPVAVRFLAAVLKCSISDVEADPAAAVRKAAASTHPDHGGDMVEFKRVQEAKAALGLA